MVVPDAAVYATLPTIAALGVWASRQFILATTNRRKRPVLMGITVRDYKEFSEMLHAELNGRYMLAEESRRRFEGLEGQIATLHSCVLKNQGA